MASSRLKDQYLDVQKRTFLKWANIQLRRASMKIDDLDTGFRTGVALCTLCEVISGEKIGKRGWNRKPKLPIHMLENINNALKFLKTKLKLVNVGNKDIHEGNITIILGLLWTIILRFQVQEINIDGISGKKGLILWAKKNTKHRNPEVNIKNLSSSWKDGLGFCALIENFRPDLIDYDNLDKTNAKECLETAFKVAEDELGIPALLDPEDLVGNAKPDEKAVTTYVSELFKYFSKFAKMDSMIHGIKEAVSVTIRHDEKIAGYNSSASDIKEWIAAQRQEFDNQSPGTHLEEIEEKLENFQNYLREAKPAKQAQIFLLEGNIGGIHNSQRHNKRPLFEPEEALAIETIENEFADLVDAESDYEAKLRDLYTKFRKYQFLLAMFRAKREQVSQWIEDKAGGSEELQEKADAAQTLPEGLLANKNICDFLEDAFFEEQRYAPLLLELADLVQQIEEPFHAAPVVRNEVAELDESCKEVMADLKAKQEAAIDKLQRIEALLKMQDDYRKATSVLAFNVNAASEKLKEPVVEESVEAVQAHMDKIQALVDTSSPEFATGMNDINDKHNELSDFDLEFEGVSPETLQQRVDAFTTDSEKRLAELAEQLAMEQNRDAVRAQFAEKANELKQKLDDFAVRFKSDTANEDPKANAEALEALRAEYASDLPLLEEVKQLQEEQQKLGIVVNPLTRETSHSLEAKYDELGKLMDKLAEDIEAQLAGMGAVKLSPQQMKELRKMFDTFDADKDGSLKKEEFHTICTAMGMVLTEEEVDGKFNRCDVDGNGEINFGEFIGLMEEELLTSSSLEDVIQSFKIMADGGKKVNGDVVAKHFTSAPKVLDFIKANMPEDGNYTKFSKELFSR